MKVANFSLATISFCILNIANVANAQLESPASEAWQSFWNNNLSPGNPTSCFAGDNNVNPCNCNFSGRSVTCSSGDIATMNLFRNGLVGTFPVAEMNVFLGEGATSISLTNAGTGGNLNTFEYPDGFDCLDITLCNTDPDSCSLLDLTNVLNGAGEQLKFCTPAPTLSPTLSPTQAPTAPTSSPTETPPSVSPTTSPTLHCESKTLNDDSTKDVLVASTTSGDDRFGSSVGISGNFMVVGSKFSDDGSMNAGAMTFFEYTTEWTQTAHFSGSSYWQLLGITVDISGDYAIGGAPRSDSGAVNDGAAHIYFHDGANWALQQVLTVPDGTARDYCGRSVAITSEYAVVGCPRDSRFGFYVGSYAAFKRDGTNWNYLGSFGPDSSVTKSQCGKSIDIADNLVVVGCPNTNRAYLYDLDNLSVGGSVQKTMFRPSELVAGARFGHAVAISADHTVVIGAPDQVYMLWVGAGKAYIWYEADDDFKFARSVGVETPYMGDNFGRSVAINGNTILVGAPGDNKGPNSKDAGSVTLLQGRRDSWSRTSKLTYGQMYSNYGHAVAVDGDHVAAGAVMANQAGVNSGNVVAMELHAPDDCP